MHAWEQFRLRAVCAATLKECTSSAGLSDEVRPPNRQCLRYTISAFQVITVLHTGQGTAGYETQGTPHSDRPVFSEAGPNTVPPANMPTGLPTPDVAWLS